MGPASRLTSNRQPRHQQARWVAVLMAAVALSAISVMPAAAQDASPEPLPEGFTRKMVNAVDDVIDTVVPVRQLPAADDVTFRVIGSDTFRTELEALFRAEYSDAHIAAEDDLFTRLGLIEADQDLEELVLSLYESEVLAYYDPTATTFSLIGPIEKIGGLESVVVAHEYGHALQDSKWGLEDIRITDLSRADAILAQQALIEGDATAVMNDWSVRELGAIKFLQVTAQALTKQDDKILRRAPAILRRQLEFPYIDGFAFVNALRGRGDWAAVDEAWEARPVSTEQILHPELYPDELPVDVQLPDIAAMLGPEWRTSYKQTLGEMQIGVWVADGRKAISLFPKLPGQLQRQDAAAGWGGDRLVSLDGPDGSWAVVWQTDWDSAADANQFRKVAKDVVKDLDGANSVTDAAVAGGLSSPVLVLLADSKGTMGFVRTSLGLDS